MLRRSVPRSAGRAILAWPVVVIVKGSIFEPLEEVNC
jgi:hypothetical protein